MDSPTFSQIPQRLAEADFSGLPSLTISVLRNITVEPLEPCLQYQAYRMGFRAEIAYGDFDNVFQEAVGGSSGLLNRQTEIILCFQFLESLSPDIAFNFSALNSDQIQAEAERIKNHFDQLIAGIRRQTEGMILWQGLEAPTNPAFGVFDSQLSDGQLGLVRQLNDYLRSRLQNTPNAYFVDLELCRSRIGAENFYDHRYWHIGRAPYGSRALVEIASENFKFIRALKGKNRKCLVLDCDNTLWGGIVGEAGLAGLKLGPTYPGSAYRDFQLEILSLYNRGIILALCSKNNEEDVWEVFEKHPDMVLQEEHIATAQINWRNKADNLKQIALDLNIGLDSLVFMDDSQFEVELIRKEIPEIAAIHLPKERPVVYRGILSSCGLFDTLIVSAEDKTRGAMYKAESGRKKLEAQATDLVSYYKSLEMELEIDFADDVSIPRMAQQTQKTNQFNLTTQRYSEADIMAFRENKDRDAIYLRLRDKFGDSGIVGTCLLKYEGERVVFDTLLLSCRVIGRGVEDVLVSRALRLARKRGARLAVGEYRATRKNAQVSDFYLKMGFAEQTATGAEADRVFHLDITDEIPIEPDYFKSVNSKIG